MANVKGKSALSIVQKFHPLVKRVVDAKKPVPYRLRRRTAGIATRKTLVRALWLKRVRENMTELLSRFRQVT